MRVPTCLILLGGLALGACGDDAAPSEPGSDAASGGDLGTDAIPPDVGQPDDTCTACNADGSMDSIQDIAAVDADASPLPDIADARDAVGDVAPPHDVGSAIDVDAAAPDIDAEASSWDWPCITDGHCKDNDACTIGKCVNGHCEQEPVICELGAGGCVDQCDPVYGCTGIMYIPGAPCYPPPDMKCVEDVGYCAPGKCEFIYLSCDDHDPCTVEPPHGQGRCTQELGCVHTPAPDGTTCDDANPCTQEACSGGVCTVSGNACSCDSAADDCEAEYGDGNLCNGVLVCGETSGTYGCVVAEGSVVSCDPSLSTACMAHSCNVETGQCEMAPVPLDSPCDDYDPCTKSDVCDGAGGCKGTPVVCDDGHACTVDRCVDGECTHEPMDCDDGNPWTEDSCTLSGCKNTPVLNPYSCTKNADCPSTPCCTSVCDPKSNLCMPGGPPETCCCTEDGACDDGDPCTIDTCATGPLTSLPQTCCGGCDHVKIPGCCTGDGQCDDGNECTSDTCVDGKCAHTLDAALCLPEACAKIRDAYEGTIAAGGACTKHEDCATSIAGDLACACPDRATTAATAADAAAQQQAWDAADCPQATGCPPCGNHPTEAAVCIEETCQQVADLECSTVKQIWQSSKGALIAQSKTLPCIENADCQQCTPLEGTGEMSFLFTHVSIDASYVKKLDKALSAACCCLGDGGEWPEDGPCCIEGTCSYTTFCPATCP